MGADREVDAPISRASRGEGGRSVRRRKKGAGAVFLFLAFGAAPIGILIWFYAQPGWRQEQILGKIPAGAGGRAIKAGICVALLFALARIALPAFHGAGATLQGWLNALRSKGKVLRVLLFPLEAAIWLIWFVVQILFAVDAALIVAAGLGTLVLVARILKPDLLSDLLPAILK